MNRIFMALAWTAALAFSSVALAQEVAAPATQPAQPAPMLAHGG